MPKLSAEFMRGKQLPIKAYEAVWNWKYVDGEESELVDISIVEFEIISYGIAYGCTIPSITGRDNRNNLFRGALEDYWDSHEDAAAYAQEQKAIEQSRPTIAKLQAEVLRLKAEIASLRNG